MGGLGRIGEAEVFERCPESWRGSRLCATTSSIGIRAQVGTHVSNAGSIREKGQATPIVGGGGGY